MLASSTHVISMYRKGVCIMCMCMRPIGAAGGKMHDTQTQTQTQTETNITYNLLLAWLRISSSGHSRGGVGRHSDVSGCGVGGLAS